MTVYKSIRVTGTSGTSVSDAIRGAVERASETLDDLRWFEVSDIRGRIGEEGEIEEYQVTIDLGFELHAAKAHGGDGQGAVRKAGNRGTRSARAQAAAMRGERGRSDLAEGFEAKRGRAARAR